jgi:Transposase DDE domain
VQVAEYSAGRQRIVTHVGSAHTDAELGVLMERARELLTDSAQGVLDFGVEPSPRVVGRVGAPSGQGALPGSQTPAAVGRDAAGRVVGTGSRLLFDALASVCTALGLDAVDDEVFTDLVIARVVEPTSLLDTGRVLADLGRTPPSYATMKRTLTRATTGKYRDQIAAACFAHAAISGDLSLCLYDVTTLYFEAEKEDQLRKVGYSKERRVDPQVVVGLLVDRHGFPLEIGCFEGNKAETTTLVPIIEQFQERHSLADMVVVADAGMLSAGNLRQLDEAQLRFIVGSRVTKAPVDLRASS